MRLTLINRALGTRRRVNVPRGGGLSDRQAEAIFQDLCGLPGHTQAGLLGEWPREQVPPETKTQACPNGVPYRAVERIACGTCKSAWPYTNDETGVAITTTDKCPGCGGVVFSRTRAFVPK